MKTKPRKRPQKKARKTRVSFAQRIARETDHRKRLQLAAHGRVRTPEADLILRLWELDALSDFRTNERHREQLTDVDPFTGRIRETAEQAHDRAWKEAVQRLTKITVLAITRRDASFFRRFADEIETWNTIAQAEAKDAAAGKPWRPVDALTTALLTHQSAIKDRANLIRKLCDDGTIRPLTTRELAEQTAHLEYPDDPRLPEKAQAARGDIRENRVESHNRNIPRIQKKLSLKTRPKGRPR